MFILYSVVYANSQQGDIEFQKGNYVKAIKYYKKTTLKEDKYRNIKLAQAYSRLADNFSKIKDFKKAKYYYNKAIQLKSRLATFKLAKLYEKEGDLFYKRRKYQLALNSYSQSIHLGHKISRNKLIATKKMVKHQKSLVHDTRRVVTAKSPSWTKAIGRLITPAKLKIHKKGYSMRIEKCSATLVNFDHYKSSRIIVTASHCLREFNKNAGLIRFIIRTKSDQMIQRYVKVYKNSHFDLSLKKSDYAILILSSSISKKDVTPVIIDKRSFMKLQKQYRHHFASLAGFSSDIGGFGSKLTYDPQCKIHYFNKLYGKSNCIGYKGASGGPVILTAYQNRKRKKSYLVGVVSYFKGDKYNHIYFTPHYIFYTSLKKAIQKYNK